jgi:hypothetical protein
MDKRRIAYWAITAFFSLGMTGSGLMNLLRPPELLEGMAHLGFPAWFPLWLGSWKLAGVAVTLAPGLARLKEWAMAGYTIALTSAFVAHLAAGDALGQAFPPLVILGLGLTSWALRPDNRRLAG